MMNKNNIKIFDSHFHIIDPDFPIDENQGFSPEPFTTEDYLSQLDHYDLFGGAIVSGSFQKQDQSYLINALEKLGPNFVGVTQLLAETPDDTILSLNSSGVRALRFNLKRGGSEDVSKISSFANRVYELAHWHVELYVDSIDLGELYSTITLLPAVSIDHLGLSKAGLPTLLKLAELGVKVKATGFGRVDFNPATAIIDLYKANPESLMFGTDLPSTRAPRPFHNSDISIIIDKLGNTGASQVLFHNAYNFYHQQDT